ncbi:MAG: hypothetical protein ACHQVS_05415 [Candidatus Babeliales bacterium]
MNKVALLTLLIASISVYAGQPNTIVVENNAGKKLTMNVTYINAGGNVSRRENVILNTGKNTLVDFPYDDGDYNTRAKISFTAPISKEFWEQDLDNADHGGTVTISITSNSIRLK